MSFVPTRSTVVGGPNSLTLGGPKGWFRAKRCTGGTCVEVRMDPDLIWVRDSKENHLGEGPDGEQAQPMLSIARREWLVFLTEVLGDSPVGTNGVLTYTVVSGGDVVLTGSDSDVSLRYDAEEWQAFTEGVVEGDFGPVAKAA